MATELLRFYRQAYLDSLTSAPPPAPVPTGFTKVFEDQFSTLSASNFSVYDNSNFGRDPANMRIQLYRAANIATGTGASSGATNGTSLRMYAKREDISFGGIDYNFTSGMLDTKSVGRYFPRYGRFEFRCKIPHGQGIWPSIWLTAKNGGATTAELDIMEYFHSQLPGFNSTTFFSVDNSGGGSTQRWTNNGGAFPRTFFEPPTYAPGWHTWACDIVPVTDAAGATIGDLTKPSEYVKFTLYLDGVSKGSVVQNLSTWWTTNGGSEDSFWQVYLNGSQIDGLWVGHPDDPLGYSHQRNACVNGGTAPNACTITHSGYTVQRAQFGDPSSTLEVDYLRVYKRTS